MCRGPFKRICHWGPLTALGIIKVITFMMVHCCGMWWPPDGSLTGLLHLSVFLLFSGLTLYHFLSAMYVGPGYMPTGWLPVEAEHCEFLQFCNTCEGYKAPRVHHCRKCGRCVQKMDHHCPWINNCVGHRNHAHFTAFLFFAVCGCLQATIAFSCSIYRALNRVWYLYYGTGTEPIVYLAVPMLVLCVFSLGLAIGVVVAVGMLLYIQLRGIYRNRTAVEDWIVEKARLRRGEEDLPFMYPYDLGWRENFQHVLSCWCDPQGDGLLWPVRDGCDQFTITREQKQQKSEKRQRTRVYTVHIAFSGCWFPMSHGWQVLCHPPFTDEARICLKRGDTVHVTRWRRHWLFGEKAIPGMEDSASQVRGWFPRVCVVEVMDGMVPQVTDPADKKVK